MSKIIYNTPDEALKATDEFYLNREGFQYTEEYATNWIKKYLTLPVSGRILDLCCGDGIWSKGMQNVNPNLELYGIDVSKGAIEKARKLLRVDKGHFIIGNAETALPFRDGCFDLVFARGVGLYNQHNMDRLATIRIIEYWHTKLVPDGFSYSIFYSDPRKIGTYTPMEEVKLHYNRCPRKTEAVDFHGGKYHHTIRSFLVPFWKAKNVKIVKYQFFDNLHFLITKRMRSKK